MHVHMTYTWELNWGNTSNMARHNIASSHMLGGQALAMYEWFHSMSTEHMHAWPGKPCEVRAQQPQSV